MKRFLDSNENSKTNFPVWAIILISSYCLFSLFIAIIFYKRLKKYFPKKNSNNEEIHSNLPINEIDDVDEKYNEFKRNDYSKLSFIRCFFGALLFFWVRLIILVVFIIILVILWAIFSCFRTDNSPNRKTSKCQWWTGYLIMIIFGTPMFILNGFYAAFKERRDEKVKQVYEKYLGVNYDINEIRPFSCYISNHLGWVECFIIAWRLFSGFVAKSELGKIPIFSTVLYNLNCLLVDRSSKDNRDAVTDQLKLRQINYLNGETAAPLLVYPEGTYTNGRYILNFKKGAFGALLPIKPIFIEINDSNSNIPQIPMSEIDHIFYTFSFLWHYIIFWELPVISYNDHMKSLKLQDESDSDCFARISNLIYQEVGNLNKSEKGMRDVYEYEKILNNLS